MAIVILSIYLQFQGGYCTPFFLFSPGVFSFPVPFFVYPHLKKSAFRTPVSKRGRVPAANFLDTV